jgi:hypothetical protein
MTPLIGAIDLPILFPRPRLRLAGDVITTAIIDVIAGSPAVDGTYGRSISIGSTINRSGMHAPSSITGRAAPAAAREGPGTFEGSNNPIGRPPGQNRRSPREPPWRSRSFPKNVPSWIIVFHQIFRGLASLSFQPSGAL